MARTSWIISLYVILKITYTFRIGTSSNKIIDRFVYPGKIADVEGEDDVRREFFVIGRRVPWNEAQAICPIYGDLNPFLDFEDEVEYEITSGLLTTTTEANSSSTLAILDEDTKDWLARMLSESNYHYDGLWIGGQRMNSTSNWTWIDTGTKGESVISNVLTITDYPTTQGDSEHRRDTEKNCLVFDKVGHDVPVLVPTNCRLRKPFVCMKAVKKKSAQKIVEGASVTVDGHSYTFYQVMDNENDGEIELEGVRKLNGGGIKWKDAKLECQRRGKHLAIIFTNEAAAIIASVMVKSRPSMESVWLGGRSVDGANWLWVSSGFNLPARKSNITLYPPWLNGHPILPSESNDFYQRRARCLVLDRHLCPEHMNPVFIDLDCEKKRPFLCQDDIPTRRSWYKSDDASIVVNGKKFAFSGAKMTWDEGQVYCQRRSGRIASISDSQILSAVLDKMTELSLEHAWLGARTSSTKDGWMWLDENGEVLSMNDLGIGGSWCLEKNGKAWPYTDQETCLNLDREGHNTPLFYGLPCNTTNQYVLCDLSVHEGKDTTSRSVETDAPKQR